MDRLILAQQVYDFSNPNKSSAQARTTHFTDQEGAIKETDLRHVLDKYFGARYYLQKQGDTYSLTFPKIHAQRLNETLANYWNLVGTSPQRQQAKDSGVKSFEVVLPTGMEIAQVEQFLRTHEENAYVVEQTGSKRYEFTAYRDRADTIKQLVQFFLDEETENPLQKKQPADPNSAERETLSKRDQSQLDLRNKLTKDRYFGPIIDSINKRKGSAFIRDVRIKDLPKDVQKDIKPFMHEIQNKALVVQYGMVVSELLKKVDPYNYKLAKEHVAEKSEKDLKKEFYDKSDNKYILLVNDNIVDGHHFLAKAEKIGATRTLKVLDLTPVRFQKRTAISLDPEKDGYHITSVIPHNGDGQPIWHIKDESGNYLIYKQTQKVIPLLWTSQMAESMLNDYLENPERYEWWNGKTDMKKTAKLLPDFQEAYLGIDPSKGAVEIINVTESPFTHCPRINLFMIDPDSGEISQIGHIDTAEGHESSTRMTIIDEDDIREEIQSLLAQLESVITVPYEEWKTAAEQLLQSLT